MKKSGFATPVLGDERGQSVECELLKNCDSCWCAHVYFLGGRTEVYQSSQWTQYGGQQACAGTGSARRHWIDEGKRASEEGASHCTCVLLPACFWLPRGRCHLHFQGDAGHLKQMSQEASLPL